MSLTQLSLVSTNPLPDRTQSDTQSVRGLWAWVERIVLVSGLVLLSIYGVFAVERYLSSRTLLRSFKPAAPAAAGSGNDGGSSHEDSRSRSDRHGPVHKAGNATWKDAPLAILRIPKLHLTAPLLDGTGALTLNHAVGRIAGTAWPGESGNIGIAGHRDSFFRGLKDVRVGDAIELETPTATNIYIVDQTQIVTPDAVDVLLPRSTPSLTLVTCYPFYFVGSAPQRFIVSASLTQQIESDARRPGTPAPSITTMQLTRRNNEDSQQYR